ncbi:hypothetical protein FQN57_003318 [Myotisia sp. PD_48]|nr:hypothetical protein FQN57_003318 [Myotisia sp. PD_48]
MILSMCSCKVNYGAIAAGMGEGGYIAYHKLLTWDSHARVYAKAIQHQIRKIKAKAQAAGAAGSIIPPSTPTKKRRTVSEFNVKHEEEVDEKPAKKRKATKEENLVKNEEA